MLLRTALFSSSFAVFLFGSVPLSADALSQGDRQALLDRLKELQEGAGGRAEKKAGNALRAFRSASASDERAHELFLNCVEKVRFEEEKKSAQDFRDWKREHKESEDSPGFRRMLRHQLNWLALTLEAEQATKAGMAALTTRAVSALDAMVEDPVLEGPHFKALEKDVSETVFARAYSVRSKNKWPPSPLKLEEVYRKHLLPPLAEKRDAVAFRGAWTKWISQEAKLQEARSGTPDKGERSPASERFLAEKRPQMLWELEKEAFALGDEKQAALAMLKLLEVYAGHPNELQWTKDFADCLVPPAPATPQ